MVGRAAEVAVVAAAAIVLTIALAAPVLLAPSERIFGMEMAGRHHDPFTVMEQFSRPLTFGVYLQPLTDAPGALLARAVGPVAAYNWVVLLTFPLSAVTAYLLARHLALAPAAAALAALGFAFSPFHLAHAAYHPHISQTQWLPLYLLCLWRCVEKPKVASAALLAGSIVAVTLSNFYGGLVAGVVTPAALGAHWLFKVRGRPGSSRGLAIAMATLSVVAVLGAAYVWYAARDVIVNRDAYGFARADLFRYGARWWSYLMPPVAHPILGGPAERIWDAAGLRPGIVEQQLGLGVAVLASGLIAASAFLRRRGETESIVNIPVLIIVAVVALVCSLAPDQSVGTFTLSTPSAYLYDRAPMFRAYARFGIVVQLMAVLMAAVGAEHLWRSRKLASQVLCIALVMVACAEYAVWPATMWRDVLPTKAHRWAAQERDPVHVLDCVPVTADSRSIAWLSGNRISPRSGLLDDCTEPNFAEKLAAWSYTHVLVRADSSDAQWFAEHGPGSGLAPAARFDDGEVFAVTAPTPSVYMAQMSGFHGREYDRSWTWRWMGRQASWRVVNRSGGPVTATLDVEMTALRAARLQLLLDGSILQTLSVTDQRGISRIGPFRLSPGDHAIVFQSTSSPLIADAITHNGDTRELSVALGRWQWSVEGARQ